ERQIALVAEIELEQSRVVLSRGRGNRFRRAVSLDDTRILLDGLVTQTLTATTRALARTAVLDVEQCGFDAGRAAQQRQLAVNPRERSRDRRDRQAHGLDAAQVVPRVLTIEAPFRNLDLAPAGRFQFQEREREVQPERQARDELVLAPVLIEVRLFHRAERCRQTLARQQALV